jgi:hypothetical protein
MIRAGPGSDGKKEKHYYGEKDFNLFILFLIFY